VHNFTESDVQEFVIPLPKPGVPGQEIPIAEVFNSEDRKYEGSGQVNSRIEILRNEEGISYAYKIQVPPLATLVIRESGE